ncbi:MAG: DUF87 domain-containing protein [Melioribacteraceae bacterium]|nr:DUF87 domain-containing protein [Saprospiraceae bacterium]MCF8396048.1 DUF87 domain-containing protein [Melioribacteraceae bacterium]
MKILMHNLSCLIKNRFVLFTASLVLFMGLNFWFNKSLLPSTDVKDLWFYSGIFMILFSILFIEPYYTSPKNVVTNTIPLLLLFLSIADDFQNKTLWLTLIIIVLSILVISIISMALHDENKSPDNWKNRFSEITKKLVVFVGRGKIIYSAVFLFFLYVNVTSKSLDKIFDSYFITIIVLWGLVLAIDPKELNSTFSFKKKKKNTEEVGVVFGVQSRKMFLVRLYEDRKFIKKFDVVRYRYSMQDSNDYVITGIVFDTYLLNQEKWAKVLQLGTIKVEVKESEKNVVYKISNKEEKEALIKELNINAFVGVIIRGSEIGKIKFEYSKKQDDLQEGDLLELKVGDKRLFYQVVGGVTEKEKLEGRNETGFIEGEAVQLGEWQNSKLSFQKFGWVPAINTPIFKADTSDISIQKFTHPEWELGIIPNTTLPSVINLKEAVSHHLALLGVTGSGKSYLAREIIKKLKENNTKIICIDFTGEWRKELSEEDLEDFSDINTAIDSNKISLIELASVSNTTQSLEETNKKLQEIFAYAKENENCKDICLVLEEAHTIVPETTFLGDYGDYSANKALVNKMSQIALQGRKYGVGLMVLAQRTANVSKTVLTQCNTIVCFQAFDETSFTFLSNYIGKDLVRALPNLKQYHAIVTGKAMRSNLPMIIDLERK